MKFIRAAVVAAFAGVSLQGAADARLLSLMMPEATAIGGLQVAQSRNSPLGQFLMLQVGSAAQMDALKDATGFDPRTDLSEIVMGSAGPAGATQVLIAGRGVFEPSRLIASAQAPGAAASTYRGLTVLHPSADKVVGAAFLDGTTVVLGTTAAVYAAIDRWTQAAGYAGPLAARIAEVSASSHAWGVSTGLSGLLPLAPEEAQSSAIRNIVAAITQFSGGLVFGERNVQARGLLETKTARDAESMTDILRLMATMVAQPGMANAATFTNSGSVVDIRISLTQQQVEDLLKPRITGLLAANKRE